MVLLHLLQFDRRTSVSEPPLRGLASGFFIELPADHGIVLITLSGTSVVLVCLVFALMHIVQLVYSVVHGLKLKI